jgi:hypothetical protein
MHLPTIVFLAPAGVCVLSWVGVGALLGDRAVPGEALPAWLTRIAFGSVAWSLAIFGLGRLHLVHPGLVVALTVAGALAGAFALPRLWRDLRAVRLPDGLLRILIGAVVLAVALDLVAASAPPTSADALRYHLALPKLWLQTGSVGDPFWRWEAFNPAGVEMLYVQGLALGGGSAAAALHAVFAGLCAFAVFGLAREIAGTVLAGAAAAFLFVLQGIVTWEATSAFVELGLTFYATLAAWHALRWARSRARTLAWAGFCVGAAAGTKYLGLICGGVFLAAAVPVALAQRRAWGLACATGIAIATGGAWYLRNWLVAGNPVYPAFFGGKWWTPFAQQMYDSTVGHFGVGHGILRLPILPLDLIVHGNAFDRGQYVGTAIFVFAVLALIVERSAAGVLLFIAAAAYCVVWVEQSAQARYLLPPLAILAAVAGAGAARWLRADAKRRLATFCVLALAGVAWFASSVALTRQLLPVTVGAESRNHFLQRLTGTYGSYREARASVGNGVVGLVGYPFPFNFPGRAVTIDVPEFVPSLSRREYTNRLRPFGIRAILVAGDLRNQPGLAPIASCVRWKAVYHGRYVTSRSLGQTKAYTFTLYRLGRCTR